MDNNSFNYVDKNVIQLNEADASRKFIANVFLWMFVGLGISAIVAYALSVDSGLMQLFGDLETHQRTGLGTLVTFAPLAFVLIMSFGINKLSVPVLTFLFLAFAAAMGISLAFILSFYSAASVTGVFITAATVFGVFAIAGYTTDTDLTKFGAILTMFLFGIVIASLVNMFMHNDGLSQIISYVGVAVFIGLTAYDVQKLKRIGAGLEYGDASANKMAIMGALTLYLDFINLFLMLLRIFGRRR